MSSNILKVNRHTINSIYIWNLVRFARAISRCEGSRCWFSNNSLNAFRIRIHILRRSPHAMPIEVKLSQNYVHIRPPNSPLKTQDPRPETNGSPAARSDSLATPWEISEAIDQLWLRLRVASRTQVKALPHPPRMANYIYTYIYMFVYCYWIFDLTLIQLKSYAIESMLKLLERSEGCVEVCLSVGKRSHC